MNANEFLNIMREDKSTTAFKLGKIDSSYVSGRPKIIFDGENTASRKQYPYISSYTPIAGDRVLIAKVSGSYVVLGKVI